MGDAEHRPARIFLSYARADQPKVAKLTAALEARSVAVWWDRALEGGSAFADVIEAELKRSEACIVAWSRASVSSHWVRDEAGWARDHGRLVPVLLDGSEPPLGFRQFQGIDLAQWHGRPDAPEIDALMAALGRAAPAAPRPAKRRLPVPLLAGLAALLLAGIAFPVLRQAVGPEAAIAADSIAVLPFANLSGDESQAYFADGIAEELRGALARIAGLKVAARTSSELVRDADVKEAAEKLGVAHVLSGSVRKGEGSIRVSAQLLNGRTGLEEWSERYDRAEGDALAVQTEIAESVANRLSLTLGTAKAMLGGTRDPSAHDAYLRGTEIRVRSLEDALAAIANLDSAVAADPGFAAARASRALVRTRLSDWVSAAEASQALRLALADARRAIALAPALPLGHVALGNVHLNLLEYGKADAAFRKAVALEGVTSRDLAVIARFEALMGRADTALALADRAVGLDPLNPATQRARIAVLVTGRNYPAAFQAIETFNRAHPQDPYGGIGYAGALLASGNARAALPVIETERESWRRHYMASMIHASLGNRAGSDEALAALKAMDDGTFARQFAAMHAMRGETDLAFAQLEKAIANRDPGIGDLRVSPFFDSLRGDPRFAAIEKRVGFPPV